MKVENSDDMETWTLLDTGVRSAAENSALDDVLLKCRNRDIIPNTLRFLKFSPNAVLVGFHQSTEQEVRIDYCSNNEIDINRRITGGGAIYLDEPQLGWELIASIGHPGIPKKVDDLYEKLCLGTVKGLQKLGVKAEFRPKNDIEVDGRKISGTGGAFEGSAFLFQGTLLTDFDVDTMLRSLRIPIEKLKDKELESVRERVTCLKWELGYLPEMDTIKAALVEGFAEVFEVEFRERELTTQEKEMLEEKLEYYRSDKWVYGIRRPIKHRSVLTSVHKAPGGLIRVSLVADIPNRRIQAALITGDFFAYPKRTIFDLEGLLKDASLVKSDMEFIINDFFSNRKIQIPGVKALDFIMAINKAIEKIDYLELGISHANVNRIFTVLHPFADIIDPSVLLLPYCSKLVGCDYRIRKDCDPCGGCSIGSGYELAIDNDMKPITILSFEYLTETLSQMKDEGVSSFIGCCCEAFYVKHIEDFEEAGVPGVIVDIDSETCYDLGKSKEAKLGDFEGQTHLDTELLTQVIGIIKGRQEIETKDQETLRARTT
ncbi:MAG: DUF116 domain-containing protein [Candidatus Thermoplasmatota archaeon]|nr:DUF116 domain-containing protein [Candidatus Thermoplasmatota archaeon]